MKTSQRIERQQAYLLIQEIAEANETTIDEVLSALEKNVVREQLSIQLHYQKTGELPK